MLNFEIAFSWRRGGFVDPSNGSWIFKNEVFHTTSDPKFCVLC